jgi:hypothetical protein
VLHADRPARQPPAHRSAALRPPRANDGVGLGGARGLGSQGRDRPVLRRLRPAGEHRRGHARGRGRTRAGAVELQARGHCPTSSPPQSGPDTHCSAGTRGSSEWSFGTSLTGRWSAPAHAANRSSTRWSSPDLAHPPHPHGAATRRATRLRKQRSRRPRRRRLPACASAVGQRSPRRPAKRPGTARSSVGRPHRARGCASARDARDFVPLRNAPTARARCREGFGRKRCTAQSAAGKPRRARASPTGHDVERHVARRVCPRPIRCGPLTTCRFPPQPRGDQRRHLTELPRVSRARSFARAEYS